MVLQEFEVPKFNLWPIQIMIIASELESLILV